MYSTCLFCHGALGTNESLEHFPVGRRLAYDGAKGRLWVVCRGCQRWNLSPLEERWEAIEEAERAFRGTRRRVTSDNIGLTRLREGLELVRIGAPPRLELISWRYGDQFGRRRRKQYAITVVPIGVGVALAAGLVGAYAVKMGGVALGMHSLYLIHQAATLRWIRRRSERRVVPAPDGEGGRTTLTRHEAAGATFIRSGPSDWKLGVYATGKGRKVTLAGEDAMNALSAVLPYVNEYGGSRRRVREAYDVMAQASDVSSLLSTAARMQNNIVIPNHVRGLPASMRLALEMGLHEEDDRRAMEGELAALDARWREAEEIAAIADSLLEPPEVGRRLARLVGLRKRGEE